jgi:hypothetical protein
MSDDRYFVRPMFEPTPLADGGDIAVIDMELLSVIRRWRYRDRFSIREIARRTGLTGNTVRKYLRSDSVEVKFCVPDCASKLDPHADKLLQMLRQEAGKSRKQNRTVLQLHADLATLGYEGSYNRVAAFAKRVESNPASGEPNLRSRRFRAAGASARRGVSVRLVGGLGDYRRRAHQIVRRAHFKLSCSASAARKRAAGQPSIGSRTRSGNPGISPPGKELLAIDEIEQRHRLAAQRVNHMPIIDDMATFAVRPGAAAPQGEQRRRALKAFEPIVIEPGQQPMADEPGGNGVEHLAQRKRAGQGDKDRDLLVIGALAHGQRLERDAFEIDAFAVAGVVAADDLVDTASPAGQIVEVARAAQPQRVGERLLQMPMRTPAETEGFRRDRAVLVRQPCVVAGRRHAVVSAQDLVAARQIGLGVALKVAERRRQAVAAMLPGDAAS